MKPAITVRIDHPTHEPGPLHGFRFFWAFYVTGFNQAVHCQPCFRGGLSPQLNTRTVRSGQWYTMDERKTFPYLYLCGVGTGPDKQLYLKNFHLPVRYQEGGHVTRETYNGYTLTLENAEALEIPKLDLDWNGLPKRTTNCKNFHFAVAYFGYSVGSYDTV